MGTINNQQAAMKLYFERTLSAIDSNQPLLLFPVRLETHFRSSPRRELCVRIFPDEIFLDYTRTTLSPDELQAGKEFWIQWFIASGSTHWEFAAWEALCKKYPPARAAWIARMTRIADLDLYRAGDEEHGIPQGNLYYRRPYSRMELVDKACDTINKSLTGVILDRSFKIHEETGEYENEYILRTCLETIKDATAIIDRDLMSCDVIVDYIYDKVEDTLQYLIGRLASFREFYDRYPDLYANNRRTLEIWDKDYTILRSMQRDVDILAKKLEGKRISLDEMVRRYLNDPKNDVFHVDVEKKGADPHNPEPHLLPEQFLVIAETLETGKMVYCFGKRVNPNLQMVPTPQALGESFVLDGHGELELEGSLKWLTDYDRAVEEGMAISVPLEDGVYGFKYVYALGLRKSADRDSRRLEDLISGHNYLGEGMFFIRKDSPTNLVEGGAGSDVISREDEIRIRYELEILEPWKFRADREDDARKLADVLKVDMGRTFGCVPHYDRNDLLKTRIATRTLWNRVMARIEYCDEDFLAFLNFTGQFLEENVSATGPFPMFRIGDIPYGVLPVTDHEHVCQAIRESDDAMLKILYDTLVSLGNEWKRLRNNGVVASERLAGTNAEKDYLKMVGQAPRSLDVFGRYMIDSPLLPDREADPPGALRDLKAADDLRATPVSDAVSLASLQEQKDAVIEALKKQGIEIDDSEAEVLVYEFLDLFSYRLDAWFTGMAYYLQNHPEERPGQDVPRNPAVGAYGWVFNLQENRAQGSKAKDEGEYILAPSIQHALTAAVLRAAYLNTQKHGDDSHMCINLSSMRARTALRMIDGLKNGLSTGVVLGADLERYLHDAYNLYGVWMDSLIYPLRQLFPQNINIPAGKTKEGRIQAANYMMQVINGEALLNTFLTSWNYNGRVSKWLSANRKGQDWYKLLCKQVVLEIGDYKKSNVKATQKELEQKTKELELKRRALFECIERMYDAYDALNDLLLSEGVHRLMVGDSASFEAISKFMARGNGNLPDPAILQTPMDYAAVSHKVALALPATAQAAGCLGKAEPALDAWVREKLGSMDNIRFKVAYRELVDGPVSWSDETLGGMGVQPLEYLYLSANDHAFKTLLEYRWRIREKLFQGSVTIFTGDPAEGEVFEMAPLPKFSLYEDSLRIGTIRSLLNQASVMTVTDWNPDIVSDADIAAATDLEELAGRYATLSGSLESLVYRMQGLIDDYRPEEGLSDEDLSDILSLQAECLAAGLVDAAAQYPVGLSLTGIGFVSMRVTYDEILQRQAQFMGRFAVIRDALRTRLAEAAKLAPATKEEGSVSAYTKAIKTLTQESFMVIPKFRPAACLNEDWKDVHQMSIRAGLASYDDLSEERFQDWLDEVGAVHAGVKKWNEIAQFQEMAGLPDEAPVILQQRETKAKCRQWLGVPLPEGEEPEDADSLVIFGRQRLSLRADNSPCAGLVFDGWMEYLPFEDHTAGMVFRCDQPDAEAPQAILLAEYPELSYTRHQNWDLEHILNILASTRFQMMNRAVDPDLIAQDDKLSRIFPLLTDAHINARKFRLQSTSYVPKNKVRAMLDTIVFGSIFEYMPGGLILKEFLNLDSHD